MFKKEISNFRSLVQFLSKLVLFNLKSFFNEVMQSHIYNFALPRRLNISAVNSTRKQIHAFMLHSTEFLILN